MKALTIVALLGTLTASPVVAGMPGLLRSRHPPETARNRLVIGPLSDPDSCGLGISIGRLLWLALRQTVGAAENADVVWSDRPLRVGSPVFDRVFLRQGAAEAPAQQGMILGGSLSHGDSLVSIRLHVGVPADSTTKPLKFHLEFDGIDIEDLTAEIPRTRFSLSSRTIPKREVFDRRVVTSAASRLRATPSDTSTVIGTLDAGMAFDTEAMASEWFQVQTTEHPLGYLNAGDVALLPRAIEHGRTHRVRWRDDPMSPMGQVEGPIGKIIRVSNARRDGLAELWYEVETSGRGARWVAARDVVWSPVTPALYFLTGLYLYRLGDYEAAAVQLERFIQRAGKREDNVCLATANVLFGASRIMATDGEEGDLDPFDDASKLTPYDPAAYLLRALARVGIEGKVTSKTLDDVSEALILDEHNENATRLLRAFERLPSDSTSAPRRLKQSVSRKKLVQIQAIQDRFPAAADSLKGGP